MFIVIILFIPLEMFNVSLKEKEFFLRAIYNENWVQGKFFINMILEKKRNDLN